MTVALASTWVSIAQDSLSEGYPATLSPEVLSHRSHGGQGPWVVLCLLSTHYRRTPSVLPTWHLQTSMCSELSCRPLLQVSV